MIARNENSRVASGHSTPCPSGAATSQALFALANAGVTVELSAIAEPVALAVAAGLVRQASRESSVSWVAVKLGPARLPTGVNWRIFFGAGCLAGIGFTMSLFISGLALQAELLTAGKIGTLLGSVISATLASCSGCRMEPVTVNIFRSARPSSSRIRCRVSSHSKWASAYPSGQHRVLSTRSSGFAQELPRHREPHGHRNPAVRGDRPGDAVHCRCLLQSAVAGAVLPFRGYLGCVTGQPPDRMLSHCPVTIRALIQGQRSHPD